MKILAISDVPSKALWDYGTREHLEGIDLILSCGDLPQKYLEYLTNFTAAPILYVHGNHDGSYRENEPGGCICVDDSVYAVYLRAATQSQSGQINTEQSKRLIQNSLSGWNQRWPNMRSKPTNPAFTNFLNEVMGVAPLM